MGVLRIVANLETDGTEALAAFYREVFGLDLRMRMDFIQTLGAGRGPVLLSLACEGGGGTPVPRISVEVDDLDACLDRARAAGAEITHGLRTEPWGVRRFFLRDPAGHLVNVLTHAEEAT